MEKRSSFSIAFYIRRTRLNKHGESPIQLRITVDHVRADTSVKRTVSPDMWNSARGRANERTVLCRELNMYLDSIRAQIVRIHREMEVDGVQYIIAQMLLDRYLGKDKPARHSLVELFEEHNGRCCALSGIDMSPATVGRYETCLRHTVDNSTIHIFLFQQQFTIQIFESFLLVLLKSGNESIIESMLITGENALPTIHNINLFAKSCKYTYRYSEKSCKFAWRFVEKSCFVCYIEKYTTD